MNLEQLIITKFEDESFLKVAHGKPYQLMTNPESIYLRRQFEHKEKGVTNDNYMEPQLENSALAVLNFDFVIDCTGKVEKRRTDMAKEIDLLEKMLYHNSGENYSSNFIRITWGKGLVFYCTVKTIDINYSLFRPDGSPLIAEIALSFNETIPQK